MLRLAAILVASILLASCSTPESSHDRYMRIRFERQEVLCPDGMVYVRGCRVSRLTGPFD